MIYEQAQQQSTTAYSFIAALYAVAENCEYGDLQDELLRDRLVVGLKDLSLSERMQLDKDLTLSKAIMMVSQSEEIRWQQTHLRGETSASKVVMDAIHIKRKKKHKHKVKEQTGTTKSLENRAEQENAQNIVNHPFTQQFTAQLRVQNASTTLVRVHAVLEWAEKTGVTLNMSKFEFGDREIKFVGCIISADSMRPHPNKTRTVGDIVAAMIISELRSFLGMVNQLGKFIPNLAENEKTLGDLTSKKKQWCSGHEQQRVFCSLKCNLSSTSVLGAMLLQKDGEIWSLVSYARWFISLVVLFLDYITWTTGWKQSKN